jgi:hypothetical protein
VLIIADLPAGIGVTCLIAQRSALSTQRSAPRAIHTYTLRVPQSPTRKHSTSSHPCFLQLVLAMSLYFPCNLYSTTWRAPNGTPGARSKHAEKLVE